MPNSKDRTDEHIKVVITIVFNAVTIQMHFS